MGICNRSELSARISGKRLQIEPFTMDDLGQSCVDLHVGGCMWRLVAEKGIDPRVTQKYEKVKITVEGANMVPGNLYLIETREKVTNRSNNLLLSLNQNVSRLGYISMPSIVEVGHSGKFLIPVSAVSLVRVVWGMPFVRMQVLEAGMAVKKMYEGHFANGHVENKQYTKEEVKNESKTDIQSTNGKK